MEFLKLLINLPGQNVASGQIRDVLNERFPGIVESIETDVAKKDGGSDQSACYTKPV